MQHWRVPGAVLVDAIRLDAVLCPVHAGQLEHGCPRGHHHFCCGMHATGIGWLSRSDDRLGVLVYWGNQTSELTAL